MLNFLGYYNNYSVKRLVLDILKRPINFLQLLILHLFNENENHYNLEVLQFFELYKYFPPISFNLRENMEDSLYTSQGFKKITDFSCFLKEDLTFLEKNICNIIKWLGLRFFSNLNDFYVILEIYHFLC